MKTPLAVIVGAVIIAGAVIWSGANPAPVEIQPSILQPATVKGSVCTFHYNAKFHFGYDVCPGDPTPAPMEEWLSEP